MSAAISSPPVTVISLPYEVRKRIYVFADLIRECPVSIIPQSWGTLNKGPLQLPSFRRTCEFIFYKYGEGSWNPDESRCVCPNFPKQLLFVCKFLHREVEGVLYGENKFIICARHQQVETLKVLTSLSKNALCKLRHLMVRLNTWPCVRGHNRVWVNEEDEPKCFTCSAPISSHNSEISTGDTWSEQVIKDWETACGYLSDSIVPGQLHLDLIADVSDTASAERLVGAMDSLPTLKECSIRLGRHQDYALRSLARSAATRLMKTGESSSASASKFLFSSLPQEIRLRILWHTNLGPGGSFLPSLDSIHVVSGEFDQRHQGIYELSDVPERKCCERCSFAGLHCTCPLNFASYHSRCQCRVLPLELFLVSRQMYYDASEIFYSTNTFWFRGDFGYTQYMLEGIPKQSLKHLRRLKFEFSLRQTRNWEGEHEEEWVSLLTFISKNCTPSKLFITIETPEDGGYVEECEYDAEEVMRYLYNAYTGAVRGIKANLPGLLDFHLWLGVSGALEPILERYVMGTGYDSKNGNRYPKDAHSFELGMSYRSEIPPWHTDL